MTNEDAVKWLGNLKNDIGNPHYECLWPYAQAIDEICVLLEEQEAVKPEREHSGGGTTWWNVCGKCKTAINPNDKFCHECGRPVKWE